MTEKILLEYKQNVDQLTLIPSSGGVFEVYQNDEKIYSKNETGDFPNEDSVIEQLRS